MRMQKNVSDQENCSDLQIWPENGNTLNNREGPTEMSLNDNWMTIPDFSSNNQTPLNLPSTSQAVNDVEDWHKQWKPVLVEQMLPDKRKVQTVQQKLEERREKNKISAKKSRERVKQSTLREKKSFESHKKENTKLLDDIEKYRIKVQNLKIVTDSIIHQDSCKDKYKTVNINDPSSGCVPEGTVENMDYGHVDIVLNEKTAINDNPCVTGCIYSQQEQQPVEQEVGIPPGLSSTQSFLFAPSGSCRGTSFPTLSGTCQVTVPANQDTIPMYSMNLNSTNDQLSLTPATGVSDQFSLIPARGVADQFSLTPARGVSDQFSLTPAIGVSDQFSLIRARGVSGQLSLIPARGGSGQFSLTSARGVSDQLSLTPATGGSGQFSLTSARGVSDQLSSTPARGVSDKFSFIPARGVSEPTTVKMSEFNSTAAFSSQSNISHLFLQHPSKRHSTSESPWYVETDQKDDQEKQQLKDFFALCNGKM